MEQGSTHQQRANIHTSFVFFESHTELQHLELLRPGRPPQHHTHTPAGFTKRVFGPDKANRKQLWTHRGEEVPKPLLLPAYHASHDLDARDRSQ